MRDRLPTRQPTDAGTLAAIVGNSCMLRLFVALTLICIAVGAGVVRAAESDVTIGVLAFRDGENTINRWSPTAEYLHQQIPQHKFVIVTLDQEGMRRAIERKQLSFILTNPGNYVELEASHGVSRLATLKNQWRGQTYAHFGAVILARADRTDIVQLSDLKGKSFMAVDRDAFGAFQIAWRELKEHGIDPFRDFSRLVFTGFPQDDVVYAVRDGKVDAGTVSTHCLERLAEDGKINLEDFRIVHPHATPDFPLPISTPLYPEWAFAKTGPTDSELAQKVAVALLTMSAHHPAARAGHYAGWTVPLDYQPVHQLFQELGIGPYRQSPITRFGVFLIAYRYWFASGTLVLLVMVGVTGYVYGLNRRLKQTNLTLEREIAEHQRVETERNKLASTVEQTADAILITDLQGVIEYVNPAFEQATGYRRDEALGKKPNLVKSGQHDAAFYASLWTTILDGRVFRGVLVNRRKDGALYYEEKTITPLKDAQGRIVNFVSTGKDVTERKLAEERARQQQAQLAHVARISTMGEMASTMAHELNQPLAAIVNYAQGCARRLRERTASPEELLPALERIVAQGERSGEIIRRMRDFAHKSEPRHKPVDINRVVCEATDLALPEARRKGIALRLDLSGNLPAALADAIQVEQVVLNLVRNAIEAIDTAHSPEREVAIRTGVDPHGSVEVAVRDTGPGLPAENAERLFEAFYTTKPEGMGMGLSISRSIVEEHRGQLRALRNPEGGATLCFTLPTTEEGDGER